MYAFPDIYQRPDIYKRILISKLNDLGVRNAEISDEDIMKFIHQQRLPEMVALDYALNSIFDEDWRNIGGK